MNPSKHRQIKWFRNSAIPLLVLLLGAMLLISACVLSGGSGAGALPAPVYTPAPKGTPTGTLVTQTVDNTGGAVTSSDSRMELKIPAGALASATAVSIQPLTNTAPNGGGDAYRFGPEGTTFSQPVTITFHLNSAAEVAMIDSGFIATQGSDGLWRSQPGQTRDANAKTISVTTTHFTDWALLQTLVLKPDTARVRVTTSADFDPQILYSGDDLLNPPTNLKNLPIAPAPITMTDQGTNHVWAVNSAPGGTAGTGLIMEINWKGHYTAPPNVPNPNPLTISLSVSVGNQKVIAVASADVYAQEQWTGDSTVTSVDGTKMDATFTFAQIPGTVGTSHLQFQILQGTVHITPPATTSAGCPLSVDPTTHAMAANEGSMTADYSLGNGPNSPMVTGGGTTVWLATYTTRCPSGPYSFQSSAGGDWWPVVLGGGTPVLAQDGKVTIAVNNGVWSGTVNLTRK